MGGCAPNIKQQSAFYKSSMSQHRKKIPLEPCQDYQPLKNFFSHLLSNIQRMQDHQSDSKKKKILFKDGSTYEGAFNMKKYLDGNGTLELSTGQEFSGLFSENKPVNGRYKTPKFEYKGEFENCLPNGEGQIYFSEKNKYVGQFKDGKRHGKGIYYTRNIRIHANWEEDELTGYGIVRIGNFYKFMGNFKNFLRDGYGEQIFKRSCCYKGNYRKNARNGYGSFNIYGQSLYEGEWKNEEMNGKGRMKCYEDGRISQIKQGVFSRNKFISQCKVHLKKPQVPVPEDLIEEEFQSDDGDDTNQHNQMLDRFQFYNSHLF